MALEKVRVLKQEQAAEGGDGADDVEYPAPIDPTEDVVEAAAVFLQEGGIDDKVKFRRYGGHMSFDDAQVPLTRRLVDQLLEGTSITSVGAVTTYTETSGNVTEELVTVSGTPLRRTNFTYVSNEVSTAVVKVYAADGSTVIGQVTYSYNYSSDPPVVTMTRDS